jgi:hypothetical protein
MITRVAVIEFLDGSTMQHAFVYSDINRAQDAAVAWIEHSMHAYGPGDIEIMNEEFYPTVVPLPRALNAEDREFLASVGVSTEGL